jgi:hypothetical protein
MPKLLVGDKDTILLIPAIEILGVPQMVGPTTLVDYATPTNAVINRYLSITSPGSANAGQGGNITCAVSEDFTLGATDPEIDDSRTVCSKGASGEIKRYNFEAELTIFRDLSLTDSTSVFNLARDLTRAPDIPYFIAHRVGYSSVTASAVGHEWDFYYVYTDNPVPVYEDDDWQQSTLTFVPKGILNVGYGVAS